PFEFSRSGYNRNYLPASLNTCDSSVYSEKLYLVNGKFKFIARGDLNKLEQCFSDYVIKYKSELMEPAKNDFLYWQNSYNWHSELLNILYDMYTITNDVNVVKNIYMKYCSDIEMKYQLWYDNYFNDRDDIK